MYRAILHLLLHLFIQLHLASTFCFIDYKNMNYKKLAKRAQYVVIGTVIHETSTQTHQTVTVQVNCVYKSPESISGTRITFSMLANSPCYPSVKHKRQYIFHLDKSEENFRVPRSRRIRKDTRYVKSRSRRKKSKAKSKKAKPHHKYVPTTGEIGSAAIPLDTVTTSALDRIVESVQGEGYQPEGHCFNIWSPWSPCSEVCGRGSMKRTYPRHGHPDLTQEAICQNAPCGQDQRKTKKNVQYQFQPISTNNCRSMELIRVRWCVGECDDSKVMAPLQWEMHPTLMICDDAYLNYQNIAITTSCGCIANSTREEYASVLDNDNKHTYSNNKKRNGL